DAREAAKLGLLKLTNSNPQVIELWNRAGDCVLSLPVPATAAAQLPKGSPPKAAGIGPFQLWHQVLYGETIVDISADDAGAAGGRLGFLVVRRTVTTTTTADALNRLVGNGASIAVGNKADAVWTDLSKPIEPPPINLARPGVSDYLDPTGERHLGPLVE